MLLLSTGLLCGGCSREGPRGGVAPDVADGRTTAVVGGGNSLDAGGGALMGMGGDPGNAYPLTPQSLFDFTQTGIAPWGPVVMARQVTVGGQTYNVNRLASSDPFTAVYQMENGDIVISNEPLERLVGTIVEGPTPPTEVWNGPEGSHTIFSGEILVLFKDEVTQQQIEAQIAQHDLQVIMSWFEPPEVPGTGNAIGYFEFRYDPAEFATFSGIYGFSLNRGDWSDWGWVPASPVPGEPVTNYRGDFRGTSFAAPQVAALAALLRHAKPSASFSAVANRIVSTRRTDIEDAMEFTYLVPLAGVIDFNAALVNW